MLVRHCAWCVFEIDFINTSAIVLSLDIRVLCNSGGDPIISLQREFVWIEHPRTAHGGSWLTRKTVSIPGHNTLKTMNTRHQGKGRAVRIGIDRVLDALPGADLYQIRAQQQSSFERL